jgi:hypothetical protein
MPIKEKEQEQSNPLLEAVPTKLGNQIEQVYNSWAAAIRTSFNPGLFKPVDRLLTGQAKAHISSVDSPPGSGGVQIVEWVLVDARPDTPKLKPGEGVIMHGRCPWPGDPKLLLAELPVKDWIEQHNLRNPGRELSLADATARFLFRTENWQG